MTAASSFPFSPQLLAEAVPQSRREPASNAAARITQALFFITIYTSDMSTAYKTGCKPVVILNEAENRRTAIHVNL